MRARASRDRAIERARVSRERRARLMIDRRRQSSTRERSSSSFARHGARVADATHRATPASTPRRAPALRRAVVAAVRRAIANRRSASTTRPATRCVRDAARALALARAAIAPPARAFARPPTGFARCADAIDGYGFDRPSAWVEVRGSGNDVFFRDPSEVETNAFVAVSSPSSSAYESVEDLGSAEDAAKGVLEQYVGELMSTRLGVRREKEILSARRRTKAMGKCITTWR